MAYVSTIITFLLLVGVIVYHVYLLVKKDHPQQEEKLQSAPIQSAEVKAEVTYSVIEIPKHHNQSPTPEDDSHEVEITPVYY